MDGIEYIDQAIVAWLNEKQAISGSAGTRRLYGVTLEAFRARLKGQNLDLDLDLWADRNDRRAWRQASARLTSEIQDFACHSYDKAGSRVAQSTNLSRLVALSSFYEFALRNGYFDEYMNPVARLKRPAPHAQQESRALSAPRVATAIRAIDRTSKIGARDIAFFAVAFETSRRVSEVLSLHWKHIEVVGGLESIKDLGTLQIALNFERCKGGKKMRHVLSPIATRLVLESLAKTYEINPLYLHPLRPLWVNLAGANIKNGRFLALTYVGARKMCKRRLGTSKVHSIRHTVAHECAAAGMPMQEIQELLGHTDIGTTKRYLDALQQSGENSVVATLDKIFGFAELVGQQLPNCLTLPFAKDVYAVYTEVDVEVAGEHHHD